MTTTRPAPGVYGIDPQHSSVEAVARHLMITKVRGRFSDVRGQITVGAKPEDSSVSVVLDTASLDTGNAERDTHLRSPDFLDVERFPELSFVSTSVERTGDDTLKITGDLTIRDITKPIELSATYEGEAQDPWGGSRVALGVTGELDREAYGMSWNVALEAGGLLVSKTFALDFSIQAIREAAEQAA